MPTPCECGCGTLVSGDIRGRPRRFVNGHNGRGQTISPEQRAKISAALTGKKHPEWRRQKNATARKARGAEHGNWKGDDVTYYALHLWLARNRTKSGKCERCGAEGKTEWANVSGRYRRQDPTDWLELCVPCHRRDDYWNPKGAPLRKAVL